MEIDFPRTVGQAFARSFFTQTVLNQAFPHAVLIHGMPGLGQSALLLDLADILLCESTVSRPCGACPGCLERKHRTSDRLTFVFPLEKKAQDSEEVRIADILAKTSALEKNPYLMPTSEKEFLSIGQIRELQNRLGYADKASRRRIVLIFGVESMPLPSANAFLKLLEEPPPNVHFLLATESRSTLIPTLLSRCIQVGLAPLTEAEMAAGAQSAGKWTDAEFIPEFLSLAEGSLGNYLDLALQSGRKDLEEAGLFMRASIGSDWETFADYMDGSAFFGDMETCARLLRLTLKIIRCGHGGSGVDVGAAAPALLEAMKPLAEVPDLARYILFVERVLAAVRAYSKPSIAALTHFLEYEMETQVKTA